MTTRSYVLFLVTALCMQLNVVAQAVRGNGNMVTKQRETGAFNEIQSHGSFNIVLSGGSGHSVKVEADENLQSHIEISVANDILTIREKKGSNIKGTRSITVHVTSPSLKAISLFGSGNVSGTGKLTGSGEFMIKSSGSGNVDLEVETSKMTAGIMGSGNITLKGTTKELDGSIQGSGNIRARELQSELTSVKISGSGNAEVVATQKITSKIAGSGQVKYWGDAEVDSKVAGSGRITRQN